MKLWLLLLAAVTGCDSGTTGPTADQPPVYVEAAGGAMTPASLGCIGGHGDPPAPTMATTVDVTVLDFEKSTPVSGATVEVYLSLDHVDNMAPDATATAPTDADGKTTIVVPPGSYRVIFRTAGAPGTIETLEFNRVYNDGARVSVSEATKGEIPALLNVATDDSKGVVAGSQRDCVEGELAGVTVTLSIDGQTYDNAANVFYFKDFGTSRVPSLAQHWTSGDGAFAGLNVPPGNVDVVAGGRANAAGPLLKLGTGVVPVRAGSITIVQLEPLGPGQ